MKERIRFGQLGETCKFMLKLASGEVKPFDNEQLLDAYIREQIKNIITNDKTLSTTKAAENFVSSSFNNKNGEPLSLSEASLFRASIDPVARVTTILEDQIAPYAKEAHSYATLKSSIATDPEESSLAYAKPYIGFTELAAKFKDIYGNNFETPFDVEDWRRYMRAELAAGFVSDQNTKSTAISKYGKKDPNNSNRVLPITDPALQDKILDEIEFGWEIIRHQGDEIHEVYEAIMAGKEPKQYTERIDPTYIKRKSDGSFDLKMVPGSYLTKKAFDKTIKEAKEFHDELHKQYKNAKFYTEFEIRSKELTAQIKDQLPAGVNSIVGRLDLLVIDENGRAHIFDYKVSRKTIGDWDNKANFLARQTGAWDSTKKNHAALQQAVYRLILEQWGITVASDNIVPIHSTVDYDGLLLDDSDSLKNSSDYNNLDPDAPIVPNVVSNIEPEDIQTNKGNKGKMRDLARQILQFEIAPTSQSIVTWQQECDSFFNQTTTASARRIENFSVEELKKKSNYYDVVQSTDKDGNTVKKLKVKNSEGEYTYLDYETDEDKAEAEAKADQLLADYIEARKNKGFDHNNSFHNEILEAFDSGDVKKVGSFAINEAHQPFLQTTIKRYIDDDWTYISDEDTARAGILIFRKGAYGDPETVYDVIYLENDPNALNQMMALEMGSSLLGSYKRDRDIDNTTIPSATLGNIDLVKAAHFIAMNKDIFKGRIQEVRVINLENANESTMNMDTLREVHNTLARHVKKTNANVTTIPEGIFMNNYASLIQGAFSRLKSLSGDVTLNNSFFAKVGSSTDYVLGKIKELESKFPVLKKSNNWSEISDINRPEVAAYIMLKQAYNTLIGFDGVCEPDHDEWIDRGKGFHIDGLRITSMQFSPSANIRTLGVIMDKYTGQVRERIATIGAPVIPALQAFYNKHGHGRDAFQILLKEVNRGDGLIDRELKRPDDPSLRGDKEAQNFIREFTRVMYKLRKGYKASNMTNEQIDTAVDNDETMFYLPLTQTNSPIRLIKEVGFFKGLKERIKYNAKSNVEKVKGLFVDQSIEEQYTSSKLGQLFNKFHASETELGRTRILQKAKDKFGSTDGYFEVNLEMVLNECLLEYTKELVGNEMLPAISALRLTILAHNAKTNEDMKMDQVLKAFDDIVKSKIYGESIIKDKKIEQLMKVLGVAKGFFTDMTLSLNVTSFFRESLQGIINGLTRAKFQWYPGITGETYKDALVDVVQNSWKNVSGVSKLQQLNQLYGMANMDLTQIAGQRTQNWMNWHNWGKSTLFLTATAPDFMHRVAILEAKMRGDGCWEAYELDDKGTLVYNFEKDNRFNLLREGKVSDPNYTKQLSLYLAMKKAFMEEGYKFENTKLEYDKDCPLPQAYTKVEAAGIKNYADLLYGHYDDESKSLVCSSFLGSFALQYKTWVTAKMEQWTMKEGKYETKRIVPILDEDGNSMYVKYDMDGEIPYRDIISKEEYDEKTPEEKAKYHEYYDYDGVPMQSLSYGMADFLVAVKDMAKNKSTDPMKDYFNDPQNKAIFALGMYDTLIMVLLSIILGYTMKALTGAESVSPNDIRKACGDVPLEYLAYNVVNGALQDAQPWQIAGQWSGAVKGEIPFITSAERFVETGTKVITGKSTVPYFLTQNVGLVRPLQGWAKQLNDTWLSEQ